MSITKQLEDREKQWEEHKRLIDQEVVHVLGIPDIKIPLDLLKDYTPKAIEYIDSSQYTPEGIRGKVSTTTSQYKSDGGLAKYYDLPFSEWVTVNDMAEYLAEHKWGKYGIHLKDIFKGICRWGEKSGTTVEYDTRKVIYYGARILRMLVGVDKTREYLNELLNDKQFAGKK